MATREDYLFAAIGCLRTHLAGERAEAGRAEFAAQAARLRANHLHQLELIWAELPDRSGLTPPAEILTWL